MLCRWRFLANIKYFFLKGCFEVLSLWKSCITQVFNFWFLGKSFICCRFICSRSGRVRWTGQLGKWLGPSSSLFSYLRSISNRCFHTSGQSQIHHTFCLTHVMFFAGVVFLFAADWVQNEQSSNCKVSEVNFMYICQKSRSNYPYLFTPFDLISSFQLSDIPHHAVHFHFHAHLFNKDVPPQLSDLPHLLHALPLLELCGSTSSHCPGFSLPSLVRTLNVIS